jgi:hypothetical protein
MSFPYPNPLFSVGFGAEQIIHGVGCECGFFRISELVRIWSGIGSDTNLNIGVICAYLENCMHVKN